MIGVGSFALYYAVEEDVFNWYGGGPAEFDNASAARKYIIEIQQTAVTTGNSNPVFAQLLSDYLNGLDTYDMDTHEMFYRASVKTYELIENEGIPAPTNLEGWENFLINGMETAEVVQQRKREATLTNVVAETYDETKEDIRKAFQRGKDLLNPTKSIVPWLIGGFVFLAIKR